MSSSRARLIALGLPLAILSAGASADLISGHNGYISYDTENKEYILPTPYRPVSAYEVELSASTALCGQCHTDAVAQLKSSVHFSVQAPNPRILFPGGGAHGALDRACGLPGTSALINYNSDINLGECGKCHVGRFIPPMEGAFTSSFMQQFMSFGMDQPDAYALAATNAKNLVDGGLDCMICHAEKYLSVRDDLSEEELATLTIAGYAEPGEPSPSPHGYAKLSRDNTDFNHDGIPDLLIDVTGDGVPDYPLMIDTDGDGEPDTGWPTIAQDRSVEAVLSVGKTDEHNCLRCHEHARTGYKRGTLFRVGYDVHANVCFPDTSLSADDPKCPEHNTCTACHVTLDIDYDGDGLQDVHKFVRGHLVGGDMAAADYPPPPPGVAPDPDDPTHLTCEQCHKTSGPTGLKGAVHNDRHLEKIACETCHITQSGGITYSMYGHGGHVAFGRNAEGRDTKVITADHMVADEDVAGDVDADFAAFKLTPVLMWFNGSTSFLAQSLAVRGAPNAKITPFKPMANGMVMDGRFFKGEMIPNEAMVPYPDGSIGPYMYNAYSMYRFYANAADCGDLQLPDPNMCSPDGLYGNADAFTALKLLGTIEDNFGNVIVKGLTPEETRKVTLMDLLDTTDPNKQTMAFMQAFPNLMNFSKSDYKYEHFLVSTLLAGSDEDLDGDGIIDLNSPPTLLFDMLSAANAGLEQFKGFNVPMFLPPSYDWYPKMESVSDVATMKLPDGSDMKILLAMQLQQQGLDMEQIQQLIGSYPAFSNGVTLGGHGVVPNPSENALGGKGFKRGCQECHGAGGLLESPVPVTDKVLVDLPFPEPMNMAEMPVWVWNYYNVGRIINLGLRATNERVVSGKVDIDIADDRTYVRTSSQKMILNWLAPSASPTLNGIPIEGYTGMQPGDDPLVLKAAGLRSTQLTWNGGRWMPVLEPVTKPAPNYAVLGYKRDEVIFHTDPGRDDDDEDDDKPRGKQKDQDD